MLNKLQNIVTEKYPELGGKEKFAELIIEECMKVVHEQYEDLTEEMYVNPEKWTPKEYWNGYISCGVDSYVAIRQHFYPIEE